MPGLRYLPVIVRWKTLPGRSRAGIVRRFSTGRMERQGRCQMERTGREAVCRKAIRQKGPMLVAYSGGADSGLLAYLARAELHDRCRCVLLQSPLMPREEIHMAQQNADLLGLPLEILPAPLLDSPLVFVNPTDRCYHCRKIASRILNERAKELGLSCVADGANVSDTREHRPGIRAATEEGIHHPFIEAGMTKEDIRAIAERHNLPFRHKPPSGCLATRIPYGERITGKNLAMVEDAEAFLHGLGVRQARVRHHSAVARIEADADGMATVFARKDEVVRELRAIGFFYVTLDLAGYRSGSMDEVLSGSSKEGT